MKFIILTLLLAFSYQQSTVLFQKGCSYYHCNATLHYCLFDEACEAYLTQAFTECEIDDYKALLDGINKDKDDMATAALTDDETCLINKKENELFMNLTTCLQECSVLEPVENSQIGMQLAYIENALNEYTQCMNDEACKLELEDNILLTDKCKACWFIPENEWSWNQPLYQSEAECFWECYNETNTKNELLQTFFKKNDGLLDDLEFLEDEYPPIEDEQKKFFEILIAFIMKIFSWLFK